MVGSSAVHCSKCGVGLFWLPNPYKMSCKVTCMKCGNKPPKKVGKAVKVTAASNYARTKKGIRKDIHPTYMFRSATEANFARILEYHGIPWKYEERSFTFSGYKTRPHVYIMDFEIIGKPRKKKKDLIEGLEQGFYEIKGYMDARSRNKLRRLRKNYPEESQVTCVVVSSKYKKADIEFCKKQGFRVLTYDVLTKHYEALIPTWE
jgi:hypothetical protein